MPRSWSLLAGLVMVGLAPPGAPGQSLPFHHKVEVYRDEPGEVIAFTLRLEQPFLAEEFEKSRYLRLASRDRKTYLIYPRETKFRQKHAEFFGRLRGEGEARLELSYEVVSENLDGSRNVQVQRAEVVVPVPAAETGPRSIYTEWARRQNAHFLELLKYYPDETFFQYVLLQSGEKYGISPPRLTRPGPSREEIETALYHTFSGGLTMQQSLQRQSLASAHTVGDLNIHISSLTPPALKSPPYEELLEEKLEKGLRPSVHDVTRLVPADQYFLHVRSMNTLVELMDLSRQWGENLLRLFTVRAREHDLEKKFEDQLCVRNSALERLFADGAIRELAITGSDIFVAEGADLTLIFGLADGGAFDGAAAGWLEDVKKRHPGVVEREFNYRGHRVLARYSRDRVVSSFVVHKGDHAIYSNSHRAIRKVIDTAAGLSPALSDARDYRYLTILLPPAEEREAGYLYASEAFLRRLVSPGLKISEKRRLECFNNLVMLNNASLFYRLEHGRAPASLTDLVEGKFINPGKLVCPHGGAYSIDVAHDTCTCSLHNRLKYLTPNVELSALRVSADEKQEYERYKKRYERFWGRVFDPLAFRFTLGDRQVRVETAVVPFANSSLYRDLRRWTEAAAPERLGSERFARSAVVSLALVPGRETIRRQLRDLPGVTEVLAADPTLTDLSWIGDRVTLHLCDADAILEVDPTRLEADFLGSTRILEQVLAGVAITATSLPMYLTIDVEDDDKGRRLLRNLAARIFLERNDFFGLRTGLDSYRLPDYREHEIHVLSFQLYALKIRFYVSLVGGQLVVATRPQTLNEVIDAVTSSESVADPEAHILLRLNHRALNLFKDDLRAYWDEKSREACHQNIMSIYNLVKLYDTPVGEIDRLSDAKYGVTYFCPDGGEYRHDAGRDQVTCSLHGNRQRARQLPGDEKSSAFARVVDSIDEMVARFRFTEESLMVTLDIARRRPE